MKEIRVALIGYGGIGHAHAVGYRVLGERGAPVRLVAALDVNGDSFESEVQINLGTVKAYLPAGIHCYTDFSELIANEEFDMVDICLPTYLHKEYAIRFLRLGKHVLSEKPMALSSAECEEMLAVARESGCRLMIGQCLRFNENYGFLKACVEDGRFGKLRRMTMQRISRLPRWGFENWFTVTERSGGCILDMHIHDVDMARYLLGEPKAVSCWAWDGEVRWQYEQSHLYYDGCDVLIEGSWDESDQTPFSACLRARFDTAQVEIRGNNVKVYPDEGEAYEADVTLTDHMANEIEFLANLILDPAAVNEKNPPESAAATVRLVERLRESAARDAERITL